MKITLLDSEGFPSELEVPQEVWDAVLLVENWTRQQGAVTWEMGELCSRNHATRVHAIKRVLQ